VLCVAVWLLVVCVFRFVLWLLGIGSGVFVREGAFELVGFCARVGL
jgi:hypothetical protein